MKRKDIFINVLTGIVTLGIIILSLFKFIINKKPGAGVFHFKEFEKITVTDMNKNEVKLAELISKKGDTYLLILDKNDCYSCIYKGIEDLSQLKKSGKACLCLVVHHIVDEVIGWSANYDFSHFYMINKAVFYGYIATPHTPVLVKFNNGEVESFRFVTP